MAQRAGADLPAARRGGRRAPADRRPGARLARRQPHRPAVHRRPCGRPSLFDAGALRTGAEIATCRSFLVPTIARFPGLEAILSLGAVAHQSTVRALGGRVAAHPFKHGASTDLAGVRLFSSYHCSRYNTNTGVLTEAMFADVFAGIAKTLRI
jgi:uracil-DNA glycosylase